MRGHIRKRSEHSWTVVVSAGIGLDGRRRQIWRTVRGPKREAERELTRLLAAIDAGTYANPGRLRLATYLQDQWLSHARTRVRPRTWERYAQLLHGHVIPLIGDVPLSSLRPGHIQSVVDSMIDKKLAARTVVQAYRVLSSALRQAVQWQLLSANPATAIKPPRPEHPEFITPDPESLNRLMEAARDSAFHVPIVLAATTGMRRGEVLGLRWRDVDLDDASIRIVSTLQRIDGEFHFVPPKTDKGRRLVALPAITVEVLRRQRKEQANRRLTLGAAWRNLDLVTDRGDGSPLDPDAFSHSVKRLGSKVGLKGLRLHDLRHAYATTLLRAGVHPKVASEMLGHSSVAFTLDRYSHVVPSLGRAAAEALNEALGGRVS